MKRPPIIWHAHEYEHREKSRDWFLAIGIITASALIISVLFENYILAILIIISGACLMLFGNKEPDHVRFEINGAGVLIDNNLFPFGTLHSFWVENNDHLDSPSKLFIRSHRTFVPLIHIPLIIEINPEDVREHLLAHIAEEENYHSFSHHLLEKLGF